MEYYPNNRYNDGHYLNPHNRFLFIFCHASDISENGWVAFVVERGLSILKLLFLFFL